MEKQTYSRMLYGVRSSGKEHGLVLTKPEVVHKMLDLAEYTSDLDLRDVKVIEPAVGEGAFALPILDRLSQSSEKHDFAFTNALSNLRFFDINQESLRILSEKIQLHFPSLASDHIEQMLYCQDFLSATVESCDLVVGNPPYVRHENIPSDQKQRYKLQYRTFTHRSDLYIPFYEKGLLLLKDSGCLSFICANRWLKSQYGKRLRELISEDFTLREVIDLTDVDAFEEDVIAYPAVTTIINSRSDKPTPYYQLENLSSFVDFSSTASKPNRHLSSNPANWFARKYTHNDVPLDLTAIAEQGFKIGIGVATGKDKVFMRKDFEDLVEHDLLLPILTSKDVRGSSISWGGNYLINPYDEYGNLIDLDAYPKAKEYFQSHKELLTDRHVSKKNPTNWYRTIDKVHAWLTTSPKIMLPDITGNRILHIDEGNFYPHHNLYYLTGADIPSLQLLAAILMSDFVREQLCEIGTKMNGGYPRWQSQNIRKLKVPYLDAIPSEEKDSIRAAYKAQDLDTINSLVNLKAFTGYSRTKGQLSFFG